MVGDSKLLWHALHAKPVKLASTIIEKIHRTKNRDEELLYGGLICYVLKSKGYVLGDKIQEEKLASLELGEATITRMGFRYVDNLWVDGEGNIVSVDLPSNSAEEAEAEAEAEAKTEYEPPRTPMVEIPSSSFNQAISSEILVAEIVKQLKEELPKIQGEIINSGGAAKEDQVTMNSVLEAVERLEIQVHLLRNKIVDLEKILQNIVDEQQSAMKVVKDKVQNSTNGVMNLLPLTRFIAEQFSKLSQAYSVTLIPRPQVSVNLEEVPDISQKFPFKESTSSSSR